MTEVGTGIVTFKTLNDTGDSGCKWLVVVGGRK